MNVIDSSVWLEVFASSQRAKLFSAVCADVDQLIIPTISVYEVYKVLRQRVDVDTARRATRWMTNGTIVDLDEAIAVEAAEFSFTHQLPMADSIIYITASRHSATLWTQDVDLKDLPEVKYFPK